MSLKFFCHGKSIFTPLNSSDCDYGIYYKLLNVLHKQHLMRYFNSRVLAKVFPKATSSGCMITPHAELNKMFVPFEYGSVGVRACHNLHKTHYSSHPYVSKC